MNIALVTAAGIGSRMGNEIPKQFLTVKDKPIIIHTLEVLQNNENIDKIVIACLLGWEKVLESHIREHKITKAEWIVEGGATGQQSIVNCLNRIRGEVHADDLIIVHDGNRPLIEDFVLNESIRVCKTFGNAVASIPCVEAIVEIEASGAQLKSRTAHNRDKLVRTQTPHTFTYGDLDQAYKDIASINANAVAPCTVMIELGKEIFLSPGSELNFKVTTQEDLTLFSALLNASAR